MATERLPGYDSLVGRWDEDRHRAALVDGRHDYFIALAPDGSEPVGFAILRDMMAPERVALIRRIAVRDPGVGHGRRLLSAIITTVFSGSDVHRIWLGLFPHNVRARRAYEAVGFVAEGIARGSAYFGGRHADELIMAILRTDPAAARLEPAS